jgi:hypothetical protein
MMHGGPKMIKFNGKTQSERAWAREYNIPRTTMQQRIKKGWPLHKVFGVPPPQKKAPKKETTSKKTEPVLKKTEPIPKKIESVPTPKAEKTAPKGTTWVMAEFKVRVVKGDKVIWQEVRGETWGIWGIHYKPYLQSSLVHIPTGKRVSKAYPKGGLTVDSLKLLVKEILPFFKKNEPPTTPEACQNFLKVVNDFYELHYSTDICDRPNPLKKKSA